MAENNVSLVFSTDVSKAMPGFRQMTDAEKQMEIQWLNAAAAARRAESDMMKVMSAGQRAMSSMAQVGAAQARQMRQMAGGFDVTPKYIRDMADNLQRQASRYSGSSDLRRLSQNERGAMRMGINPGGDAMGVQIARNMIARQLRVFHAANSFGTPQNSRSFAQFLQRETAETEMNLRALPKHQEMMSRYQTYLERMPARQEQIADAEKEAFAAKAAKIVADEKNNNFLTGRGTLGRMPLPLQGALMGLAYKGYTDLAQRALSLSDKTEGNLESNWGVEQQYTNLLGMGTNARNYKALKREMMEGSMGWGMDLDRVIQTKFMMQSGANDLPAAVQQGLMSGAFLTSKVRGVDPSQMVQLGTKVWKNYGAGNFKNTSQMYQYLSDIEEISPMSMEQFAEYGSDVFPVGALAGVSPQQMKAMIVEFREMTGGDGSKAFTSMRSSLIDMANAESKGIHLTGDLQQKLHQLKEMMAGMGNDESLRFLDKIFDKRNSAFIAGTLRDLDSFDRIAAQPLTSSNTMGGRYLERLKDDDFLTSEIYGNFRQMNKNPQQAKRQMGLSSADIFNMNTDDLVGNAMLTGTRVINAGSWWMGEEDYKKKVSVDMANYQAGGGISKEGRMAMEGALSADLGRIGAEQDPATQRNLRIAHNLMAFRMAPFVGGMQLEDDQYGNYIDMSMGGFEMGPGNISQYKQLINSGQLGAAGAYKTKNMAKGGKAIGDSALEWAGVSKADAGDAVSYLEKKAMEDGSVNAFEKGYIDKAKAIRDKVDPGDKLISAADKLNIYADKMLNSLPHTLPPVNGGNHTESQITSSGYSGPAAGGDMSAMATW